MMQFVYQETPSNPLKVVTVEQVESGVFVRINGVIVIRFDGLDGVCAPSKSLLMNEGVNLVIEE
jgi:uncharacterized membrane protein